MFLNRKCFMTYNEDSFQFSRKVSEANFASTVLNRVVNITDVVIENDAVYFTHLTAFESKMLEKAFKEKYEKLNYRIKHDAEFSNQELISALAKSKTSNLIDSIFYKVS